VVIVSLFIRNYGYDRLPNYFVEAPLLSGRSTISEHMCENLIQAYGKILSTFQKSEHQSLRHLGAVAGTQLTVNDVKKKSGSCD
jgi:hypothetical protein